MSGTAAATPEASTGARPALEISGLWKSFGNLRVLRGLDLTVAEHEVVCLIGSSGCGKSTLLRCVNLLEPIDAGRILICTDCAEESRVAGPKQIDRTGPRLGPRLLRPDHALLSSAWPKSSHRPLWVPNPQVPLCVHGRSIPAPIPYVRYDRSSRPEVGTLRRERR